MNIDELNRFIQQASEHRLAHCVDELHANLDEFDEPCECFAPFCGCDTCVVREVIDAAWPYLYRLAHHPDTVPPELADDLA